MSERPWLALLALLAIGLCGFFVFPGHTYLHQDSQIYLPMLERLSDGRLLERDLIAIHPHLTYTFYDEILLALQSVTGASFQPLLVAQQILTRLLGLLGVFLLGRSAGLRYSACVLTAGLYGLGATIGGASVLTLEYEPTPRSFALPLITLSAGLASMRMWTWAGAAAFLGFLYHAPTVAPVLGLLLLYAIFARREEGRWRILAWVAAAACVLALAAKWQPGIRLQQDFFSRVSPDVQDLQRMRASYVFVGAWFGLYWVHYVFLSLVALAAWRRMGDRLTGWAKLMLAALPVLGLLSVGFSYIAMDKLGWSLIPQLQPARTVLWITFAAVAGCGLAAGAAKSVWERALWLVVPLAAAVRARPLELLTPANAAQWQLVGLVCVLAVAGAIALRYGAWATGLTVVAAMGLFLYVGGVRNYPSLHSAELDELSAWARSSTPMESMFHFPDAGKDLYPGIFRARAVRAVWVDWKGGGQVNFMEPLAREWWRRWSALPAGTGDYLVRKAGKCGGAVLYSNAKYCVERP